MSLEPVVPVPPRAFEIEEQPLPPRRESGFFSRIGCCHIRMRHLPIWMFLSIGGIVALTIVPAILRNVRLLTAADFVLDPECQTLQCLETTREVALALWRQ